MTLLPIVLPDGFSPKVSLGDQLKKGTIIAEKKGSLGEEVINLTSDYQIPQKDINKSLKKNLGDFVEKGEVIAVKSGGFGKANKILSSFSGTIAKIDESKGEITIKTANDAKAEQIFSPVEGKVEICNNEKIVIKTSLAAIMAKDSLGGEAEGKLYSLQSGEGSLFNQDTTGKILLIKTIDKASVFKAIGLDVLGIITKELEDLDFIDLTERKISIPIMLISEDDFGKIAKHPNANIYLNGKDKSLIFYE